jgi:hypothetical protein
MSDGPDLAEALLGLEDFKALDVVGGDMAASLNVYRCLG